MLRWMMPLIALLAISACVMKIGSTVSGGLERTIDAPRKEVFAAIVDGESFRPLRKVSNMGSKVIYQGPIEGHLTPGSNAEFKELFNGGAAQVTVEPSRRVTYQLTSVDRDTVMKLVMEFADAKPGSTAIKSHVELQSDAMPEAKRKGMEVSMNVIAGVLTFELASKIERRL